jgi:Calcineurin-like phosphoesterase
VHVRGSRSRSRLGTESASIPFYADRFTHVNGLVPALVDRVARDPDIRVVTAAIQAVRVLSLATSGLPDAVHQRLDIARSARDTSLLGLLNRPGRGPRPRDAADRCTRVRANTATAVPCRARRSVRASGCRPSTTTFTAGPAQFFAINTNELTERQLSWLRDALAASTAKWKFVYGHFPVYEQTDYTVEPQQEKLLPILKEFHVDAYFAGHHHSMHHWFIDNTDYIVAGAAGAPNYSLEDTTATAPGRMFALSAPGFAVAEVQDSVFRLRFIGGSGRVLYEYERRK